MANIFYLDGKGIVKDTEIKKHISKHEPYEYFHTEIVGKSEPNQLRAAIYELPPHKSNYPYHYHEMNTEIFYIIAGKGLLRSPEGERIVKAGDIVVCPPGEESAHKISNASDTETLRYLDIDTTNFPDTTHYPDSEKTGKIFSDKPSVFYDKDGNIAKYYDGE